MNLENNIFDPGKSLFDLLIFKVIVTIPVVISIVLYIIIVENLNLVFDFSYEGIKNAIEYFRIPISFLGMLIPVVGIASMIHRSNQISFQINQLVKQNIITNYVSNKNEFVKHYVNNLSVLKSTDYYLSYGVIYNNSMNGDYSVDKIIYVKYENLLNLYFDVFDKLKTDEILLSKVVTKMESEIQNFQNTIYCNSFFMKDYVVINGIRFDKNYICVDKYINNFAEKLIDMFKLISYNGDFRLKEKVMNIQMLKFETGYDHYITSSEYKRYQFENL